MLHPLIISFQSEHPVVTQEYLEKIKKLKKSWKLSQVIKGEWVDEKGVKS